MSKVPKRPSNDTLEYIKAKYRYDSDVGLIYNILTDEAVGYADTTTGNRQIMRMEVGGKKLRYHHVAWFLHCGEWPDNQIDHKDRDNFNNRINNLRKVDEYAQQRNKDNYTGYKGFSVLWDAYDKHRNSPWRARSQSQEINLGRYESVDAAKRAIDEWLEERNLKEI